MSKEQLNSHLNVKAEITSTLYMLVKYAKTGHVYPDGVLLTNRMADISGNPASATTIPHDDLILKKWQFSERRVAAVCVTGANALTRVYFGPFSGDQVWHGNP